MMRNLKDSQVPYHTGKPVHHNSQSGQTIYEFQGKFYFYESWGLLEFNTLAEAIQEEARIDPRLGWN